MADGIGDDIDRDGSIIVPDEPQTRLAFRTWRLSEQGRLLSINAPSLTGKAGGTQERKVKVSWIHRQLADDEGQTGWPVGKPLIAHCGQGGRLSRPPSVPPVTTMPPGIAALAGITGPGTTGDDPPVPNHGPIPEKHCSCGIYATTSINVINQYLGNEVINGTIAIRGPVLGIVEMGGRIIPATQGYRAAAVRVAAIMLIDEAFTLSWPRLRAIAEFYKVPALTDRRDTLDPEDYRDEIMEKTPVNDTGIGDEAEDWLAKMMEDDDEEDGEDE